MQLDEFKKLLMIYKMLNRYAVGINPIVCSSTILYRLRRMEAILK
jgi:hypothetical protein